MSEYPKEIEGIVVNNAQEEEIAKEELARAKIKLQIKNKKTFAKVQVAAEQMKESINQLNDKKESDKRFIERFKLEQDQKLKEEEEKYKKDPGLRFIAKTFNISIFEARRYFIWGAIIFFILMGIIANILSP